MKRAMIILGSGMLVILALGAATGPKSEKKAPAPASTFSVKCMEKKSDATDCMDKAVIPVAPTSELFLRAIKKRERRLLA